MKVKQLLESGADANMKDNAGWTALHEACNHGYTGCVEELLKARQLVYEIKPGHGMYLSFAKLPKLGRKQGFHPETKKSQSILGARALKCC